MIRYAPVLMAMACLEMPVAANALSCPNVPADQIAFRAGAFEAWIEGSEIRAGASNVTWTAGGCALLERWTGAVSGDGTALYAFHGGRWHLYFVNSDGGTLDLSGSAIDGGVLFEGSHPDFEGRAGQHRMLFAPEGKNVRQTWEFRPDTTGKWELLVDIIQRRKPPTG